MFFRIFLVFFISIFLSSCEREDISELRHPLFIKAENLYNEGKIQEAYVCYEKYFLLNPKSAKTSYKLALISQDNGNYIKAIYYYEKYLLLNPKSSDREIIEKWINSSKKSLVQTVAKEVGITLEHKEDTSVSADTQIELLKKQNEELITKLQSLKEEKADAADSAAVINMTAPQEEPKIYIVQEGDTLYKISQKMYGTSKYYGLILEANKDKLKGSTLIRTGDKIIIPSVNKTD